jgi:hypothetical protein
LPRPKHGVGFGNIAVALRIEHHVFPVPIEVAPLKRLFFPAGDDGFEYGKDEIANQQKQEKAEQ